MKSAVEQLREKMERLRLSEEITRYYEVGAKRYYAKISENRSQPQTWLAEVEATRREWNQDSTAEIRLRIEAVLHCLTGSDRKLLDFLKGHLKMEPAIRSELLRSNMRYEARLTRVVQLVAPDLVLQALDRVFPKEAERMRRQDAFVPLWIDEGTQPFTQRESVLQRQFCDEEPSVQALTTSVLWAVPSVHLCEAVTRQHPASTRFLLSQSLFLLAWQARWQPQFFEPKSILEKSWYLTAGRLLYREWKELQHVDDLEYKGMNDVG